jgi:hypothetical protein
VKFEDREAARSFAQAANL